MTDPDQYRRELERRKSLKSLGERLRRVRGEAPGQKASEQPSMAAEKSGLGIAWRISVEMAVAIGVCTAIGYGLDRWLGTKPWLMLALLFLGFGAGVRNVYRTAQEMARASEEKSAAPTSSDEERKPRR